MVSRRTDREWNVQAAGGSNESAHSRSAFDSDCDYGISKRYTPRLFCSLNQALARQEPVVPEYDVI